MLVLVVVEALFTVVTVVVEVLGGRRERERGEEGGFSETCRTAFWDITSLHLMHISVLSVKFNSVLFSLAHDN